MKFEITSIFAALIGSLTLFCGPAAHAQSSGLSCIRELRGNISASDIADALQQAQISCAPARPFSNTRSFTTTRTLKPVPVSLVFPNVQFAFDRASLLPEAFPILDALG